MPLNLPISAVSLERGDTGLGFNIRGGKDIPHVPGDTGIFVSRVKDDGAAYKDGRLGEGDKILEVNGKNIENVNHSEAVNIFVNAGNIVKMKVQHGAYTEIMKQLRPSQEGSGYRYLKVGVGLVLLAAAGIGAFVYMRHQ